MIVKFNKIKKMKLVKIILFVLLAITLSGKISFSQNIRAEVKINTEKLSQDKRHELQNFDQIIKRYLENGDWMSGIEPFDLKLNVQILFERFNSSYEESYSAKMYIFSNTGFVEVAKSWDFPYQRNQQLAYNPNIYDGLTGLFNFYINIIIGEQLDRYETFAGQNYFIKALNIAQYGKADRYNKYWNRRETFLRKYLTESHKNYRAFTAAYYAATYYDYENNAKEARTAAADCVDLLKKAYADPNEKEFLLNFFRKEAKTIGGIFKKWSKDYEVLFEIDPEHKDLYTKIFKN